MTSSSKTRRPAVLALAVALVLGGCGGADPDEDGPTTGGQPLSDVGPTTSAGPEAVDRPAGAVGFDDLDQAVVQIEATGTFESPGEGALERAGRGSGFVISDDGLAVTNNHVVTGAGALQVWLDGEEYNARVLGVSECLDLAVIDIDGDALPFLQWREGDIPSAMEVWAAGFPLGDPDYTITRGIVSKKDTEVATGWAALDHVIEHDARIREGNSGGPLVDAEGRVVGVNYAGVDELDFNYAIHRDEVLRVLEELTQGTDVLSLGVNGEGWVSDDGSESGVFVSSVAAGSPADKAGLAAGDLITSLQGVSLATGGTLEEYCSVLRTHGTEDTLDVEAYRPSEDTPYAGQINGEALVAQSVPEIAGADDDAPTDREFVTVTDDEGVVTVDVPAEWSDVNGASWSDDLGNLYYDVTAAVDVGTYFESWDVSGVQVSASSDALDDYTPESYLAENSEGLTEACTPEGGPQPYDDGAYQGLYEVWLECGGSSSFVQIAAVSSDGGHLVVVNLQMLDGDVDVLETVLSTFIAVMP